MSAFRGFYKKDESQYSQDFIIRMLYSARSIILAISLQAAMISGLLAVIFNSFNAVNFVLIAVAFIFLHVESNLLNDYFGYRYGHDIPDSPRRRCTLHPLADNVVTEKEMRTAIIAILAVMMLIGIYFTFLRGVDIILLAAAGAGILFMYLATAISAITLHIPLTLLLVFANMGRFRSAVKIIRTRRPEEPPANYMGWPLWYHRQALRHSNLFGWLYIAGLLIFAVLTGAGLHIPVF